MASVQEELNIDVIRQFMIEKGGRVTNHELVSNFRRQLNNPQTKGVARQKFKEYVNKLATVKQIEGVKYLTLRPEHYSRLGRSYSVDSAGSDVPNSILSPSSSFRSSSGSFHEPNVNLDTSLPPMTQLPTRTLFEAVCQAVQENVEAPMAHSESTPANLDSYGRRDSYNYNVNNFIQDVASPTYNEYPSSSFNNDDGDAGFLSIHSLPDTQNMLTDKLYDDFQPAPIQANEYESQMIQQNDNMHGTSSEDNFNDEIAPHPPPRRKSSASKYNNETVQEGTHDVEKENVPVVKVENANEVSTPISVRERAQKLNKMVTETELNHLIRNRDSRLNKGGDDDDDVSSVMSLDPLRREWTLAAANCDYHALLSLLKQESRLFKAKDYISGYTALHWGAKHGNADIIKLIAGRYGLNSNVRSNGGYTPLHLAAMHGHEDIMELLVKTYGADVNIRDYSGKKPRQYMGQIEATVSEQVKKICTQAQNRRNSEKEIPSFLRIGSLNVKVQKTISSMSLRSSQTKSWGSADNLQELLSKQMPAPKFVPVKRNKSKRLQKNRDATDVDPSCDTENIKTSERKPRRRPSFKFN